MLDIAGPRRLQFVAHQLSVHMLSQGYFRGVIFSVSLVIALHVLMYMVSRKYLKVKDFLCFFLIVQFAVQLFVCV